METKSKGQAFGLLFLTFFIWGSVYVGGRLVAQDLPPALVACLRCCTAMLPLLAMAKKHLGTKIDREDWKYLALIGGVGYFLNFLLIQLGVSLAGATVAALVNAINPVTVTVLAALILKERITPVTIFCIVLAIVGTVVITWGAGGQGELMGIAAILVAVVAWGFASVYMRQLTAKYPAILVTTYGMAISLIFQIPAGIFSAVTQPVHFSARVVLVILYLGFFGSGVAQYTWTRALSILPASTCSLFYPLQPVFSALLGALILKESFTPTFLIGLLLISADVALSTWEAKKSPKNEKV